jgi:CheY-like chemotaxis protein
MPGKSLVMMEDDTGSREGLAAVLRGQGYTVTTFPDAQAVLNYLTTSPPPDLILLDMIMPVSDGWRFLEERRNAPALASAPVVLMTGLGVASDEWAASLGASALLRKPVEVESLLAAVRRCLPNGEAPTSKTRGSRPPGRRG